jgi:chromosome partitioning protein
MVSWFMAAVAFGNWAYRMYIGIRIYRYTYILNGGYAERHKAVYTIGMSVITLTSRKGGVGKTLLAIVLAGSLAEEGADVALLDADANGSAHRWVSETHKGSTIHAYAEADAERLAELLPTLAERHAVLIVDTAGFGNQAAAVAIAGADLVLVPVTPGEADLIEAQRTVAYVGGLARSTRRAIPVRVVANRIRRQTTLSRHVLAELERLGLPRLQTVISETVAYGELTFAGELSEVGPAAEESAALIAELRGEGWLP